MERELLPTEIKFHHYELKITPNLENFTFEGESKIVMTVVKQTLKLILNAKSLLVKECIIKHNNEIFYPLNIDYDEETERVIVVFSDELPLGDCVANIKFSGVIDDSMNGFYKCKYIDDSKNISYAAVTQFEPIYARRMFPCADEPSLKSTFKITLIAPKDKLCLSNTMVESEQILGDLKEVVFEKTPFMSTYLLALYIGHSDFLEQNITKPINGQNLRVRVYTPVGKKEHGRFALEVATRAIDFFATYFDIDYPLKKLDMIAIPDFSSGAMENWGLVTYRTKYMLYDPETTSNRMKLSIAGVICHELAHQWFGNLVTMEWWNDLWLNESFATWMGYMVTDKLYPEFNVMEDFMVSEYARAMSLDELHNSHPIEVTISKASEADEIFDAISYAKGASTIRMLVNYMGDDAFKKGIRHYLKKYMYGNATTNDLWNALEDVTEINISHLMDSWTKNKGYPILTMNDNIHNNIIKLSKIKYNATGPNDEDYSNDNLWVLPLNIIDPYSVGENNSEYKPQTIVMTHPSTIIKDPGTWIKLNHNQTGFYKTKYCKQILDRLKEPIQNKFLNTIDRGEIIMNLFSFSECGYCQTIEALDFLDSYMYEKEPYILSGIVNGINNIISICSKNRVIWRCLADVLVEILTPIAIEYGFDKKPNDTFNSEKVRNIAISTTGIYGNREILAEAHSRTQKYLTGDKSKLSPNLRKGAFTMYIKHGGQTEMNKLIELFKISNSDEEKLDILIAIGKAKSTALLVKAFDFVLNSGYVRPQDMYTIFSSTMHNQFTTNLPWQFFHDNLDKFIDMYEKGDTILGHIITSCIKSLISFPQLERVKSFLETNPKIKEATSPLQNKINQAFEVAKKRIEWFNRDYDCIKTWVNKRSRINKKKTDDRKLDNLGLSINKFLI